MGGTGDKVVAAARRWIGTPYRHQAATRGAGCDCLGLIRGVWREVKGGEPEAVPAYSMDWAEPQGDERLWAAAGRHLMPVGTSWTTLPRPEITKCEQTLGVSPNSGSGRFGTNARITWATVPATATCSTIWRGRFSRQARAP